MRVVGVVAGAPADHTCLTIGYLVGLAFEAGFVYAVFADCAVFHRHVPTPQSNCVPLFDLDALIDLHSYHLV